MTLESVAVYHNEQGLVASLVYLANTPWTRFRGLMGTAPIPAGSGMLFDRTNAIHGFFMRYPLTVIYLAVDRTIVKVTVLKPWRLSGARRARWVLELSPETPVTGLKVGDRLEWH